MRRLERRQRKQQAQGTYQLRPTQVRPEPFRDYPCFSSLCLALTVLREVVLIDAIGQCRATKEVPKVKPVCHGGSPIPTAVNPIMLSDQHESSMVVVMALSLNEHNVNRNPPTCSGTSSSEGMPRTAAERIGCCCAPLRELELSQQYTHSRYTSRAEPWPSVAEPRRLHYLGKDNLLIGLTQ